MAASIETGDAGEYLVCSSRPDEWLGIFVVNVDVFPESRLPFSHAAKYAAADAFVGDFGEPALDQVEPGAVGECEVQVKARPFCKPFPDDVGLVCAIGVQHNRNIEICGNVRFNGVQNLRNS
jgi:hypothetical protein